MSEPKAIRVAGRSGGSVGSPRRRGAVIVVLVLALGIAFVVAGDPASESGRTAVTTPPTPESLAAEPVPRAPIADPLNRRVPGFTGTLVMTAATAKGTEVWRWSTGADGVLQRSMPIPDLFDARPDPTGTWAFAIKRTDSNPPLLEAAIATESIPVHWGADSFAWGPPGEGALGWMASTTPDGARSLHVGLHLDDGLVFKPTATLDDLNPSSNYRVVAFDELGFVVQQVSEERSFTIHRLAADGTETGSASGRFVGISPSGQVAALDGDVTRFLSGENLAEIRVLGEPLSTVAWTTDGSRLAATDSMGTTVEIFDGRSRTTFEVGDIRPSIFAWDAIGRFVLVAGHAGGDAVIVFVDSASRSVRTVFVAAEPINGVVVP